MGAIMQNFDLSDICMFSEFVKKHINDFNDNLYIPYLIGSPIMIYKDSELSKKNDALVPVLLLVKKPNGIHEIEEVVFNWKSIDLLQTYSMLDIKGQLHFLGNMDGYADFFDEVKLKVDINNVKEISLKDVVKDYSYYTKLTTSILKKYENENFLLFTYDDSNYIVPTVEVIRFFYCFSQSDSLKHSVFHPSGIKYLVKNYKQEKGTNKHNLFLESICEIVDYKKVFYFAHKKKYLSMFHSIYFEYKKHRLLSANFPFEKNFQMACKTLKLPSSNNTYLITKILESNMLNTFFKTNNIDLHIYHPLSKRKEDYTGKRNTKNDKKRYEPKNKPSRFNDKLSTKASIPKQTVLDEPNIDYFPNDDYNAAIESCGTREERGGVVVERPINVNSFSTGGALTSIVSGHESSSKEVVQMLVTSELKSDIYNYPKPKISIVKPDINNLSLIISQLRKEGFSSISYEVYEFPDKSKWQRRVISYTDKVMMTKRQYVVMTLQTKCQKYVYLDVAVKGTKKEILLLINQPIDISHQCIYHQVYYGSHKWLSKNSLKLIENVDYIRIRHSSTSKIVENILDVLVV